MPNMSYKVWTLQKEREREKQASQLANNIQAKLMPAASLPSISPTPFTLQSPFGEKKWEKEEEKTDGDQKLHSQPKQRRTQSFFASLRSREEKRKLFFALFVQSPFLKSRQLKKERKKGPQLDLPSPLPPSFHFSCCCGSKGVRNGVSLQMKGEFSLFARCRISLTYHWWKLVVCSGGCTVWRDWDIFATLHHLTLRLNHFPPLLRYSFFIPLHQTYRAGHGV